MSEQHKGKKVLIRSLPWIVLTCLMVFFLMACNAPSLISGTSQKPTPTPTPTPTKTATPTETATPAHPAGAFKVTGIDTAVQPQSIAGKACGTAITVTYTATFHITANNPGGTIHFTYTVNNGRSSMPANVVVKPDQTNAIYAFSWSGNLPADHTYPGLGGVMVTSPNAITSPLVKPNGMCS